MSKHIKKKRKYLGNRSHGGGNAKNRRGKGNRGGIGNAGKLKHKWFHTIKFELEAMRKKRKGFFKRKSFTKTVKLFEIASGKNSEFEFDRTKIIGGVALNRPVTVKASAFSENARQSIEKAGGKAIII
jgi:large subunit ribosomal protein L15